MKKSNSINYSKTQLEKVPRSLRYSPHLHLHSLDLSNNKIVEFPGSTCKNLVNVEVLNLQKNQFLTLPPEIRYLTKLRYLFLDNNQLCSLPEEINTLSDLCEFSVTHNKLIILPHEIGKLPLKKLQFSDNRILALPQELENLHQLEVLHTHNNRFTSLPCSLFKLKKINNFSLDWFLYTPILTYSLQGMLASSIWESLSVLCKTLQQNKMNELSLIGFLQYFAEFSSEYSSRPSNYLHSAAADGHFGVLKSLLQEENINTLNKEQCTPLTVAIKQNSGLEIISLLLEHKAEINLGGSGYGSPLHLAVLQHQVSLVKRLIQNGASVNCMDEKRNTPLHLLCTKFDENPVKSAIIGELLLVSGAKPNLKNSDKLSALHLATKRQQQKGKNIKQKEELKLYNVLHLWIQLLGRLFQFGDTY